MSTAFAPSTSLACCAAARAGGSTSRALAVASDLRGDLRLDVVTLVQHERDPRGGAYRVGISLTS
jgi:hypothetical protein